MSYRYPCKHKCPVCGKIYSASWVIFKNCFQSVYWMHYNVREKIRTKCAKHDIYKEDAA